MENRNGRSVVSADSIGGTRWEPRVTPDIAAAIDEREGQAEVAFADKNARFATFVSRLLSLSPKALLVVRGRYQAMRSISGRPTLAEIGRELHCSRQAVYKLMEEARGALPALDALFSGTDTREKRNRRKHNHARNC